MKFVAGSLPKYGLAIGPYSGTAGGQNQGPYIQRP